MSRMNKGEVGHGTYEAVSFLYGNTDISNSKPDVGLDYSGYHPPFPLPENLLICLPPTEKLHQIIARTSIFVSKHGGQSEIVLRVKQGDNPTFGFLMPGHHLHAYFRFLVEHPNLLSNDMCPIDTREEKNPSGSGENESQFAGGALSLLGSVYGSVDEDEGVIQESSNTKQTDLSNPADTVTAEKTQQSNKLSSFISGTETKSLPTSKESTLSLRKSQPAVPPNSSSANSKSPIKSGSFDISANIAHPSTSEIEKLIVEPPSTLKETISKIVEFILRNGREFEAVLIEQDRPHGRFPFLLPTNLYHSYYLKVLQEAQEFMRLGKKPSDQKSDSLQKMDGVRKSQETNGSASQSSASQSEGLYDPDRKEKFKMVIGGPKKDLPESSSKPAKESGVSVDVAAAIVLAATRGLSSPRNVQIPAKSSGISADMAAAIVMAATRGSNSLPEYNGSSKIAPSQSCHSSSLGVLSALRNGSISISGLVSNSELGTSASCNFSVSSDKSARKGIGGAESLKVANAIARNVALAAASEADSSEASLTKEQKLKAERLKRAKLFTSLVKSGGQVTGKLLPGTLGQMGSQAAGSGLTLSGSISDLSRREGEGGSLPVEADVSGKSDEKDSTQHESKQPSRKHTSRSHRGDNEDLEEYGHLRKKHHSETLRCNREDQRHKRHHHSLKSNKHESSSEDELLHRKRSRSGHHHHRHCDCQSDPHGRRKSYREGKQDDKEESMATISEQPDHTSTESPISSCGGVAPLSVAGSRPDAMEVSDDLRAKVRAMLLATL